MQKKGEQACHSRVLQCKDFETVYDYACAIWGTHPLCDVKTFLDDSILDINADKINTEDWKPICESLTNKHNLKFVAIRSFSKNKKDADSKITQTTRPIHTEAIVHNLVASIACSLRLTSNLTCLELQKLRLTMSDVEILGQSLSQNHSIQHLSLHQCLIGDNGLEVLFRAVKNSFNITSANFSRCGLTWKSALTIVNFLKHQTVSRHSEAWKETLRHEIVNLDAMGGMQRLTLNGNPLIGDKGAHILSEILQEDIWLKAIDIQQCGIQESGARALLNALKYNTTLYILDIRDNSIRDHDLLVRITQQLCFNVQGQTSQFKWLTITKQRWKSRIQGERIISKKRGIPWRVGARCSIARNYNTRTPGVANVFYHSSPSLMGYFSEETSDYSSICSKIVKTKCSKKLSTRKDDMFRAIRAEVAQLKQLLSSEKAAKDKAERRINELLLENDMLKNSLAKETSAALDSKTMETIEATFKKFNDFLKLLHNVGYGNLVNAANMTLESMSVENLKATAENLPDANERNKPKNQIKQGFTDTFKNAIQVSKTSDSPVSNSNLSSQGYQNIRKNPNGRKGLSESKLEMGESSERQFRSELNTEKVYTYLSSDWSKLEISSKRQTTSHHSSQHSIENSQVSKTNSAQSSNRDSASDRVRPVDGSDANNVNSSSSILTRSSTTSPESLTGIITTSDKF